MTHYPDNVREFTTQESVPLGTSGYDVEVEIVRKADIEVLSRQGEDVVSIGLNEFATLPDIDGGDLLVIFDLGTVLDIDDVRFSDTESGDRLPIKSTGRRKAVGPVRVPTVLRTDNQVSLLLSEGKRPFGTLTVTIQKDGSLTGTAFLSDHEGI